jgi:lipoate-protein ligase A
VLKGRGQWWDVVTTRGTASDLHDRPMPESPGRRAWVHAVDAPALVLGSSQTENLLRRAGIEAEGIEVCRRRSGGGAVLVGPDDTWIDLVIDPGDPLWDDDVSRAFHWVGHVWASTLEGLGLGDHLVHTGPLQRRRWGSVLCFAGLGPGEVTEACSGNKVVGLSQRRTRSAARFQCLVPRRVTLEPTAALLTPDALPPDLVASEHTIGAVVDPSVLTTAFLATLHELA